MPHPLDEFRMQVRAKAAEHGYHKLTAREFTMLQFDWLADLLSNGNGRRRQQATLAGLPIAGVGGFWALTQLAAWVATL